MFSVLSINLLVVFAKASNRPLTVPIKVAQNLYLEDLCIKNSVSHQIFCPIICSLDYKNCVWNWSLVHVFYFLYSECHYIEQSEWFRLLSTETWFRMSVTWIAAMHTQCGSDTQFCADHNVYLTHLNLVISSYWISYLTN